MDKIKKLDKAMKKANKVMAAPITKKKRDSLKKSQFCGPDRSFPVDTCNRAKFAKIFLNRSKFSKSTKQKIAACINRKSKSLGCKPGKPAKVKASEDWEIEWEMDQEFEEMLNSDIFEGTKELLGADKEEAEQLIKDWLKETGDCCKED